MFAGPATVVVDTDLARAADALPQREVDQDEDGHDAESQRPLDRSYPVQSVRAVLLQHAASANKHGVGAVTRVCRVYRV